jgi:hypothetical protein
MMKPNLDFCSEPRLLAKHFSEITASMRLLALFNVLLLTAANGLAQSSLTLEQENVINDWKDSSGGKIIHASNDPKAAAIHYQLARFTGMQYPVIFAETVDWGYGHFGGVIIIDQSSIDKDRNILAFIFAHEWAHQLLGHQPNIYRTSNGVWKYNACRAQSEDEADVYAGKFLAIFGYEPNIVYDYLSALPKSDHHTHSTGKERAELVRRGYTSVNVDKTPIQQGLEAASSGYKPTTVKCTHLVHPAGDEIPCKHFAHHGGHLVRCKHPCGAIQCHLEGDIEPCTHPVHDNGDRVPCTHLLHPSGDIEKTRSH